MLPVLSESVMRAIMGKFGKTDSLDISKNGIREIEDMSPMDYLIRLNLSDNLIVNVDGLQGLTNLTQLNLSKNRMSLLISFLRTLQNFSRVDISGLSSLIHLQSLDLSTNSLRSPQSLRPLEGLQSLQQIMVANNPFSNSNPHYAADLSRILPQITEIDAKIAASFGTDISPLQAPVTSPNAKGRPETQTERYLRHYIRGLESQVAGYQKMFTDKELLISGLLKEGTEETECAYAVLTLWREQCHREMMGRLLSEERESIAEKRAATERREAKEKIQHLSSTLVSLTEELAAARSLIEDQQRDHESLCDQLEAERELRISYQERSEALQTSLDRLRTFLEYYREKMDREMITLDIVESKMEHRMVSLEGRLTGATERINVLGTLLQMKEVELRNSQAVLAAERRLFWLREERRKEGDLTLTEDEGEGDLPQRLQHQTGSSEELFLSDVRIDPEIEALLRTIFRHLDPSDSGAIELTVLHSCLLTARAHGLLSPSVERSFTEDPCVPTDCDGVGNTLWDRFINSLCDLIQKKSEEAVAPSDLTITWGELLLLFIPEPLGHPDAFSFRNSNNSSGGNRAHSGRCNDQPQQSLSESHEDLLCICRCEKCQHCEWKDITILNQESHTSLRPVAPSPSPASRSPHKPSVYSRLPLTTADYASLHQAKLLNDCQWAMIPLQISLPGAATTGGTAGAGGRNEREFQTARELSAWLLDIAKSGCCSCCSGGKGGRESCCDLRKVSCEAVRLATERSFLLRRLQNMTRALERRAESIRGFFETELRRGDTRLQKATLQLTDCQSCLEKMEERLRVQDNRYRSERKAFEERLLTAETENEVLQQKLSSLMSDREMHWSRQLEDSSLRSQRLESELKLLRKELSKNEVTNKTLQRDLIRLQNANSAAQETTNQLRSERDELEGLWNTSQEDLQSLRRRLEDTERHLAMLETERDKLQQQPQSPPLPQSQQLSSPSAAPQPHSPPQPSPRQQQQQQSPPLSTAQGAGGAGVRRGGGAGDRFDALASKLLFMSDRLSRIDP